MSLPAKYLSVVTPFGKWLVGVEYHDQLRAAMAEYIVDVHAAGELIPGKLVDFENVYGESVTLRSDFITAITTVTPESIKATDQFQKDLDTLLQPQAGMGL